MRVDFISGMIVLFILIVGLGIIISDGNKHDKDDEKRGGYDE